MQNYLGRADGSLCPGLEYTRGSEALSDAHRGLRELDRLALRLSRSSLATLSTRVHEFLSDEAHLDLP